MQFLDKSKVCSLVKFLIDVPIHVIFSWYVPGKASDLTSSVKLMIIIKIYLVKYYTTII